MERRGSEMDIYTASSLGDEEYVQNIIMSGGSVDESNTRGWTPLMYACWGGHMAVAKLLVQQGALVIRLNFLKQPSLFLAVMNGSLTLTQLVFQKSFINHVDCFGKTALFYAVEFNHPDIARFLLEEGANMNFSCGGSTPLSLASSSGLGAMVALLLTHATNNMSLASQPIVQTMMAHPSNDVTDLKGFLECISLEKYWPIFKSQNIDLQKFLKMNESDLKSTGIK